MMSKMNNKNTQKAHLCWRIASHNTAQTVVVLFCDVFEPTQQCFIIIIVP